jgi:ABC-type phosphate/phosphonate transport system substrate-binding protein
MAKAEGNRTAPSGLGHRVYLVVTTVICGLLFCGQPDPAHADEQLPKIMHVAFSSRVFPDIDQGDAQIAMELWARELARKAGIPQAKVTIFADPKQIEKSVRRGEMHIITLSAQEYLANRQQLPLVPAYVSANKTGPAMELLLIVHRSSGIRTVADLRGKRLITPPLTAHEPAKLWLSVLMGTRSGSGGRYFDKVIDTTKPSQAVIAVFFRQFDAAVVRRGTFETCKAVNPQLGRELAIIAESKSLVGEITCLPATIGPRMKQAIDAAAASLHETTVGRQMATLFQIDRVIPFKPTYLTGLEELLRHREQRSTRKEARP